VFDAKQYISGYGEFLEGVPFDVITLHPLADEPDILDALSMAPEECLSCDLYWAFRGRVVFVSVFSAEEPASAVYFLKENVYHPERFVVTTRDKPLRRRSVVSVVSHLCAWLENNNSACAALKPGETLLVSGEDIAKPT
jgi:hypothetical protein